ncbi:dipeptide epimerase [Sphingosinicellaceae bacterium]|nr:dipeptide epimerase [Sphingosinicellaceae bacterium]
MAYPVAINGLVMSRIDVVEVTVRQNGVAGRGEAAGVYYHDDTSRSLAAAIETARGAIENGADRPEIARLLPPGGARNAVDCALWDLESRLAELPVWQIAGLAPPRPLLTTITIGADDPASIAARAKDACRDAHAIKLKLNGDGEDGERVRALRAARPDVWIGVDANQGLDPDRLSDLMPVLVRARVSLVEQPGLVGAEEAFRGFASPIPMAADESAQTEDDLERLRGLFDVINIKLDKCGGLTAALAMAVAARARGFGVMVGSMGGTSLAMAPAFLTGQGCDFVDLDGPVHLESDRSPAAIYRQGRLEIPPDVWGWSA